MIDSPNKIVHKMKLSTIGFSIHEPKRWPAIGELYGLGELKTMPLVKKKTSFTRCFQIDWDFLLVALRKEILKQA